MPRETLRNGETSLTLDELFAKYYREERQGRLQPDETQGHRSQSARRLKSLEAEIIAHPESFDKVRLWMVDVTGKMGDIPAHLMDERAREYIEKSHEAVDRAGPLAQSVRQFIERQGFDVTDSGYGAGEWTVGAYCTEPEARRLAVLLYKQFTKAIAHGLLRVERLLWSIEMDTEPEEVEL